MSAEGKQTAKNTSAGGPVKPVHLQLLFLALLAAGAIAAAVYWEDAANFFDWGVATGEAETAVLEQRLAALEEAVTGAAGEDVSSALAERVDALEKNLAALRENAEGRDTAASGPSAAFAAALADLAFPLFSSQPFEAELERARALTPSLSPSAEAGLAPHFTALSRRAPMGIPSLQALHASFDAAALAALREGAFSEDAEWWERTLARLKGLIVVRRVDGASASPTEALFRDVETALAAGRLEEALALLEALPEREQAPFESWLAEARARAETLAAYRILAGALR
ncbi:MAG TPA: hypothetical protein VD713_07985 [Sphingomonadales bacterium]|nr:hypothetical protein [Sphingomonadales bacterium]